MIANQFRFIDLFAGIGGLRRPFEQRGGICVLTCERDRFCRKTYDANFSAAPSHQFADDIRTLDARDVPPHDVLLAGFPCPSFSIAGVSKRRSLGRADGFEGHDGDLFFELARIVRARRPAVLVLENVRNLVTHRKGTTFARIREILDDELNYELHTRVIDARAFVPQHRERIFIIGFCRRVLDDQPSGFDFATVTVPAGGPRLATILHPEDGSEPPDPPYTDENGHVSARYILTEHLWRYLQNYAAKHKAKGNGFGCSVVGPDDVARTLSARYHKDGSEILIRRHEGPPRRLTPRECARLMGFDAPRHADWIIPVSDTQAYRQFGNAVAPPVIAAITERLVPLLRRLPISR